MTGTVTIADSTLQFQAAIDKSGNMSIGPVSAGATPVTSSSGNVAAAAAVATLAAVAAKTTYITGFEVTSSGSVAAAVVSLTVAGVIGGTMTFTYATVAGVTAGNTPLIVQFPAPIPASAINTAIVVTLPSLGAGNTNATVVAHGFQI